MLSGQHPFSSPSRAEDEKALLFNELRHRYKNNLQTIQSFLHLKAQHTQNPNTWRDLKDVEMYIAIVNGVEGELLVPEGGELVLLNDYLRGLVSKLKEVFENISRSDIIRLRTHGTLQVPAKTSVIIGLIVNEAVTNCFKHAVPRGATKIDLVLSHEENRAVLFISDDGPGVVLQEKRHSGTALMRRLAERLGAGLTLDPDWSGTRYILAVPLTPSEPNASLRIGIFGGER